jgi:hypothetical protein
MNNASEISNRKEYRESKIEGEREREIADKE